MKKFFYILSLFIIFNLNAKIISTDKISDLEEELIKADCDTLVIFGVDNTLIESVDRIWQKDVKSRVEAEITNPLDAQYQKLMPEQKYKIYATLVATDKQVIDPVVPNLINALQARGVRTLAVTKNCTGDISLTEKIEDVIENNLQKAGIFFKNSWPKLNEVKFESQNNYFAQYDRNIYPSFKNGIIFTCHASKGEFVQKFIKNISPYKFKKIILVDSDIANILSVEKSVKNLNIEYLGIEYTYSSSKIRPLPFDIEKARVQFNTLIKEQRWIKDINFNNLNVK